MKMICSFCSKPTKVGFSATNTKKFVYACEDHYPYNLPENPDDAWIDQDGNRWWQEKYHPKEPGLYKVLLYPSH
jgi:hypothetical protein